MPPLLCPWEAPTYIFFSSNVPPLVFYSHVVAIVSALGIGLLIFANNPRSTVSRLILLVVSLFSVWGMLDVILWATNRPDVVMFSWSLQVLIEPLTYTLAFYLFYLFLFKRWPSLSTNLLIVGLLLPVIVLLPTVFNLQALQLSSCEAIEGPIAKYYTYIVHAILMLGIAFLGAREIPKISTRRERIIALCFGLGLVTFLLSFTSGNIISSFTDDWTISQYGLFGMPVFAALIAYSIVQFKAFNAKTITAQMLVVILAFAVISLATLQNLGNVRIIAVLTFLLVCVLGYILVRSVKREIAQREQIQKLAGELQLTNERQETLIHFISHEVKGFLTKDMGAFAALSDGDFGPLPEALKPFVTSALIQSSDSVESVMGILKASNIKKGTVAYQKAPFDLAALAAEIVEKARPLATKKGLALSYSSDPAGAPYTMSGDAKELGDHVLRNIIENSVNYTPTGSITVSVKKENNKFVFSVADTGIGITAEDKSRLFTEGGHGKDSQKVNVHSTGYGLYIAKNIVEAHGGTVRAESDGAGKGTRFIVELPI